MTRMRLLWVSPLLLAPVACSDGAHVDIGHGHALLSDYAASWDGYAEAYAFPDGSSDRVRIVLDATGEGTLQVGDAALDPTPTDPNVPLPSAPGHFHDGFLYPIHAATVDAGRIQFTIDPETRWAGWCAIQVPYAYTEPLASRTEWLANYICVDLPSDEAFNEQIIAGQCTIWQLQPNPGAGASLVNPIAVSCNRYKPCLDGICSCTASTCAWAPWGPVPPAPPDPPVRPFLPTPEQGSVDVDGALTDDGATLVGTLVIHPDWNNPDVADRVTIRLQRH